MKENKNNEVVKYILENYDIKNAYDIADALKDMFKDTIQAIMNAEFEPQIVPKNKRDITGIEEKVKQKWNSIYPTSLKVWEDNWEAICTLFNYSKELRRIMYTTNAIESLNRSYRKYTKTKGVFTSDIYIYPLRISRKNGLPDTLIGI